MGKEQSKGKKGKQAGREGKEEGKEEGRKDSPGSEVSERHGKP